MTAPRPRAGTAGPGRRTAFGTAPAAAPERLAPTPFPELPPAPSRVGLVVLGAVGISVAAVAALVALGSVLVALGSVALVATALALVPLGIVLIALRWVDRWEPEPIPARVFALLWGAGFAVVAALLFGDAVQRALVASGVAGGPRAHSLLMSLVQAPVAEESVKGLGVLAVFLFANRLFDGPIDGVVYAGFVAGGFAFVENMLYFGQTLAEGGAIGTVFVLRGVLAPFAHVMFTAMTGLGIGIGGRRGGMLGGVVGFVLGLLPAMLLHALWNLSAAVAASEAGYLTLYIVVQMPLFFGLVAIVLVLNRQESAIAVVRLREYASAGWFSTGEPEVIGTARGRAQARRWARTNGRTSPMRRYLRMSLRLAFARQRIVLGHGRSRRVAQQDELVMLQRVVDERARLLA